MAMRVVEKHRLKRHSEEAIGDESVDTTWVSWTGSS